MTTNSKHRFSLAPLMTRLVFMALVISGSMAAAQDIPLVKLGQLQQLLKTNNGKILVINFWATWCAPCLKELPLFEKLNGNRQDVAVSLVSMDMDLDPDPQKVKNFVIRKKIKSPVLILDETNPNSWIDKLEKSWSGALPATLVINSRNGKRKFVEKELHEGDLEKLIADVL